MKPYSALGAFVILIPASAHAEGAAASRDQTVVVEELIVTAQKREARLAEVAAPLSVISGAQVEQRGISDFEGLVEQIPGVSITADFGGAASKVISIRGVGGTDDYRPNGSPSVAFHMDNIYQTSNVFLTTPLFDVDRVEVLKGPQGTLYGRNSTAGVVNVITRGAGDELSGYAVAEYGSYDRIRLEGAVGGPISERISGRIAVLADRGGGFMDGKGAGPLAGVTLNPTAGPIPEPGVRGNYGDRDVVATRATGAIRIGDQGELVLKANHSRDKGETQLQDSVSGVSNGGFREPDNDPYTFYSWRYPKRDINISGLSAAYLQPIGEKLALDVVVGWQEGNRFYQGGIGAPVKNFDFDFSDLVQQQSLEVRLSSKTGGAFDWVVGAYGIEDKTKFFTFFYGGDTVRTNLTSNYVQTRGSQAVFGQADWKLTDKFTLTAGARFTSDSGEFKGATVDLNPFGNSRGPVFFPAVPVFFSTTTDDENLSGRVTLAYQATEALKIYGSVGTGYKAGGFDGSTIFSRPEANPFKAEDVVAYELGFKYYTKDGLHASVDAFYYDFSELQAFTVVQFPDGSLGPNVRTNVGKSEFFGADFSFGATLLSTELQSLKVNIGTTLLNSEILEFKGSPAQVALNLGNDLPAAPQFSGNANVVHALEFRGDFELRTTIDVRNKSSEFKRLNNAVSSLVQGYTLIGLRTELLNLKGGWSVFAYGRNLTDEIYYQDQAGASRLVGTPRTFGFGARANF